jgi:diguanylate cyclase (GGDEF)-like protein/PAS domain S-box-containing protein
MRIRSLLISTVGACVALTLVAGVFIAGAAKAEHDAGEIQSRAQSTSHEVSGLLVLTQEYARHFEDRSAQQWHLRHSVIAATLQASDAEHGGVALRELRSVTQSIPELFDRLEDLPQGGDAFTLRRREVLVDQLLTSTQAMSDFAYQWYQEADRQREDAERSFHLTMLLLPGLMLAMMIVIAFAVRQRVLRPMRALDEATTRVAQGDLTVRTAIARRDEFGDLSRRFDSMTEALARSDAQLRESGRRLRDITDNIPAMIGYFDSEERCLFANSTVLKANGYTEEDTTKHTLRSGIGEEAYALHAPHVARVLAGEVADFEGHLVRKGVDMYFQAHFVPDLTPEGTVRGFYVMTFDVTPVRQAEKERARSEQQLRAITDNLPVLISYLDHDERIRFANETFRPWLHLDPAQLIGKRMRDVVNPELYEARRPYLERALAGERVAFEQQSHAFDTTRTTQTTYIPDVDEAGAVRGVYTLSADVTALKDVERRLQALARFDTLTRLPNRLQLNERLPEALARAQRSGQALTAMFLDIDKFKAINDSLGHAAGDEVLREFALRLQKSVRTTDTVARLAGDEFVVVLEGLRTEEEALAVASKIIAAVNLPMPVAGTNLEVSTSIGIAYHAPADEVSTAESLLEAADQALYAAKNAGRNTFKVARLPAESAA